MEIAEIKQHLTLAQVLQHYELKPDKHLRLHCPFHEDKTPSLQVSQNWPYILGNVQGAKKNVAVTVSNNGFIVGANPASRSIPIKK